MFRLAICDIHHIYALYSRFISTLLVLVFCFVHSFIHSQYIYLARIEYTARVLFASQKKKNSTNHHAVFDERIREKLPIKIRGFKFTYILKSYGCALRFIGIIMYKPLLYIRTGCVSLSKTQFWSIHKRIARQRQRRRQWRRRWWMFAMKQSIRLARVSYFFSSFVL